MSDFFTPLPTVPDKCRFVKMHMTVDHGDTLEPTGKILVSGPLVKGQLKLVAGTTRFFSSRRVSVGEISVELVGTEGLDVAHHTSKAPKIKNSVV